MLIFDRFIESDQPRGDKLSLARLDNFT